MCNFRDNFGAPDTDEIKDCGDMSATKYLQLFSDKLSGNIPEFVRNVIIHKTIQVHSATQYS